MIDEAKLMEEINALKETVIFLTEQERLRGEATKALDEKIEAVKSYVDETIINPSLDAYESEKYDEFAGKYGDRLGKHNALVRHAYSDPEYDITREAYDTYNSLPAEDRVSEEDFVASVEGKIEEYVAQIKKELGLPDDIPMEIENDGNGNTEVKADTDGDGKTEPVAETSTEEEVIPVEEPEKEEDTSKKDEEEMLRKKYGNIDLDLARDLEAYSKK